MSSPSLGLTAGVRVRARLSAGVLLWSVAERILAGVLLIALLPLLAVVSLDRDRGFAKNRPSSPTAVWAATGRNSGCSRSGPCGDRSRPRTSATGTAAWIEYLGDTHVPAFKAARDPRVTSRLALFCRRFSLDELPQLIHVVSGSMRLVGPRPITRIEWNEYYGVSSVEVLSVRPGLTGLWQVMGRNGLTYAQRRRLADLFYARHQGAEAGSAAPAADSCSKFLQRAQRLLNRFTQAGAPSTLSSNSYLCLSVA